MNIFGDNLRKVRTNNGHTPTEVAHKLGISVRSYFRYESGESFPSKDKLVEISDFFEVSIDYLLGCARMSSDAQRLLNMYYSLPHDKRANVINAFQGIVEAIK